MPMVPELAVAVLACARIGAIHSVVFAGFSAQALADRIKDATAKIVITSDGNFRGAKTIPVKEIVDQAIQLDCHSVQHVLVVREQEPQWNGMIHEMYIGTNWFLVWIHFVLLTDGLGRSSIYLIYFWIHW